VELISTKVYSRPAWLSKTIPILDSRIGTSRGLKGIVRLRDFLRELAPDIAVANDTTTSLAGLGLCPVLRYSHGGHSFDNHAFIPSGGIVDRVTRGSVHHVSYMLADAVVANSEWCARSFRRFGIPATVNFPGVDVGFFSPIPKSHAKERLVQENCLPRTMVGRDLILSVGTIQSMKRQDLLIRAFVSLRKRVDNVGLVIIGNGPKNSTIRSMIDDLRLHEDVLLVDTMLPDDEELKLWYNASAIFVHPSEREHFGMVTAEAQACGTASVVPDKGGGAEIVVNGYSGLHFASLNPESCADKMAYLLRHPDESCKMGAHGRERVISLYALEKANAEFYHTLARLLQHRPQKAEISRLLSLSPLPSVV